MATLSKAFAQDSFEREFQLLQTIRMMCRSKFSSLNKYIFHFKTWYNGLAIIGIVPLLQSYETIIGIFNVPTNKIMAFLRKKRCGSRFKDMKIHGFSSRGRGFEHVQNMYNLADSKDKFCLH